MSDENAALSAFQTHMGGAPKPAADSRPSSSMSGVAKPLGSGLAEGVIGLAGLPGDLYHDGLCALWAIPSRRNPASVLTSNQRSPSRAANWRAYKPRGTAEEIANKVGILRHLSLAVLKRWRRKLPHGLPLPLSHEIGGKVAGPYGEAAGALTGAAGTATAAANKFRAMGAARNAGGTADNRGKGRFSSGLSIPSRGLFDQAASRRYAGNGNRKRSCQQRLSPTRTKRTYSTSSMN